MSKRRSKQRDRRPTPRPEPGGTDTRQVAVATAIVFVVALAVHAIVAWQYTDDPFFTRYVADAQSYDEWGARLARDGLPAEPVFHQSPLFPLVLGALYGSVADAARPTAALALQALLSSLAVALLVPVGRIWFGRLGVGVAAAVVALAYGPLVYHDLKLMPGALALATQTVALALLGVARLRRTLPWCALAGGAMGVAALARAEWLLFVPVAALAVIVDLPARPTVPGRWRRALPAVALLIGCGIAILPATLHNTRMGDRVLIASAAGENLFIGNQRGARGGYKELTPRAGDIFSQRVAAKVEAERALGKPLQPSEVSRWWAGRTFAEIAADPAGWLTIELRKLGLVLHPGDPTEIYSFPLERSLYLPVLWLLPLGVWPLFLLGAAGAGLSWPDRRSVWPLAAQVATHLAVLLAFFVDSRLRMPFVFSLLPFCGVAVVRGLDAWRAGRRRLVGVGVVAVLVAAVVSGVATRTTVRDVRRLSSVLSIEGRLDEALAVLDPMLGRPTPDPFILDQAGWVSQKMERFVDAARYYERALADPALDPVRARQTRTRLATVLERLGDFAGAMDQHNQAVASGHANAGTYYERGMFLLRHGQANAARQDLEQSARLDPGWPAPRAALARLAGR